MHCGRILRVGGPKQKRLFATVNETKVRTQKKSDWSSLDDQRALFDRIGTQLGVSQFSDWYGTTSTAVRASGAAGLLNSRYGDSLYLALTTIYPEHEWLGWKFKQAPKKFWQDQRNCKAYFDWLGAKLGVTSLDQWYSKASVQQMRQNDGSGFLLTHTTLLRCLQSAYPDHAWSEFHFKRVPKASWSDIDTRRSFLQQVGERLNVNAKEDWYQVSKSKLQRAGAWRLIAGQYSGSLLKALSDVYRDHKWLPWKFQQVSAGFWDSPANQRDYFDWLGKELGIVTLEGWYSVTRQSVDQNDGCGLISRNYNNNLSMALASVYPQHVWIPWLFYKVRTTVAPQNPVTKGFWDDRENRVKYFQWLEGKLAISDPSAWYRVLPRDVEELGGKTIMSQFYGGDLCKALRDVFPGHTWEDYKFITTADLTYPRR